MIKVEVNNHDADVVCSGTSLEILEGSVTAIRYIYKSMVKSDTVLAEKFVKIVKELINDDMLFASDEEIFVRVEAKIKERTSKLGSIDKGLREMFDELMKK